MDNETKQFEGHTPGAVTEINYEVWSSRNKTKYSGVIYRQGELSEKTAMLELQESNYSPVTTLYYSITSLVTFYPVTKGFSSNTPLAELLKERDTLKEKNSELADQVIKLMKERDGAVTVSNIAEAREARYSEALNESKSLNTELLEALKFLFSDNNPRMFSDSSEQKAKAAIAKAEGREHAK